MNQLQEIFPDRREAVNQSCHGGNDLDRVLFPRWDVKYISFSQVLIGFPFAIKNDFSFGNVAGLLMRM